MSGTIESNWLGILLESGQLNQVSNPSNLANASWTKTSMSCVRTATGPDGVTNSASTCTSSGANGTVTASIPAGTGMASVYLKRRTGTGAVLVTRNNFSSSVDVGPALSSTRWRRAVPAEAPGCAGGDCIITKSLFGYSAGAQTLGLKLATSGDAVDIWTFQEENLTGGDVTTTYMGAPTSPMNENTGTRLTDRAEFALFSSVVVASMAIQYQYLGAGASRSWAIIATDNTGTDSLYVDNFGPTQQTQQVECWRTVGGVIANAGGLRAAPFSARTFLPVDCQAIPASTVSVFVRGRPDAPLGSATANVTATKVRIGGYFTAGTEEGGVYRGACVDSVLGRCTYNGSSTGGTPIVWIGDSLTSGELSAPPRPPNSLETLLRVNGSTTGDHAVYNLGVGGDKTQDCLTNWRTNVRGKGYSTLILLCGVNSAIQGNPVTAAGAFANLQAIMDEARADGLRVIPITVLAHGADAYTDSLNALITTYASTYGLTLVDAYNSDLRTGSGLTPAYDFGDHLHLNAAGADRLAALVFAVSP